MGKGAKKTVTTNTTALDPSSQRYVDAMRMQAQNASNVALNGPGGMPPQPGPRGGLMGMIPQMPGAMGGAPGGPAGGSWFTGPQTQSVGDQAAAFFNPYQQNVLNGVQGQFDHLRSQALTGANQEATQAGAFGGSRAAVLAGTRLGALDQSQMQTMAGLQHQGYQNALQQGTQYAEQQRQLQQQRQMEPLWRQQQAQQFMNLGMGPTAQTNTQTTMAPRGSALGSAASGAMAGSAFGPWGTAIGGGLGLLGGLFG